MSHWRYLTDCATGIRHWHLYSRVSRPERALLWRCARAAVVGAPLLALPGAAWSPPVIAGAGQAAPFGYQVPWLELPPVEALGLGPVPFGVEMPTTTAGGPPVIPTVDTPEPTSIALLAAGVAVVLLARGHA